MGFNEIMQKIANDNNTNPEQVFKDMQDAIEAAKDNPNFKAAFGDRTPSVEEFISFAVTILANEGRLDTNTD